MKNEHVSILEDVVIHEEHKENNVRRAKADRQRKSLWPENGILTKKEHRKYLSC